MEHLDMEQWREATIEPQEGSAVLIPPRSPSSSKNLGWGGFATNMEGVVYIVVDCIRTCCKFII